MNVFKSLSNSTAEAKTLSEDYLKASHSYLKLKIFQQLTLSFSLMIKLFAIGGVLFIAFLFLAISGALAIGQALGNLMLGCLAIAAILVVIAVCMYLTRKTIERAVIKTIAIKFFD